MASTINATPTSSGLIQTADNSGVLALQTGGTTAVTVDGSQNIGIGTSSPTAKLDVNKGSAGVLANFTDGVNTNCQISTTSLVATVGPTAGSTALAFQSSGTERMRIGSSGNLLVGTTTNYDGAKIVAVGTNPLSVVVNGVGGGSLNCDYTAGSGTSYFGYYRYGGNLVGQITSTGSGTSYSSISDYRVKENIELMTGALDKVSLLKPVTYRWKADGSNGQGFIAHELQAVVPDCVTGAKDAVEIVDDVDAEGKVIGTKEIPKYQAIDTSFLVATLTSAIQEQQALITDLTTRLSALEGVA
jgi:hypothetical protein